MFRPMCLFKDILKLVKKAMRNAKMVQRLEYLLKFPISISFSRSLSMGRNGTKTRH